MGKIEQQAKQILKNFPQIDVQPASISGKYHWGETCREHLEACASVMRHLCDAFNIKGSDRDMLVACAYLHDLGLFLITLPASIFRSGENSFYVPQGWKYFNTGDGWLRSRALMILHPLISAAMLDEYEIDRKEEIKEIISSHMGHWYKLTPQPTSFYQKLLVIADYLASREKEELFTYKGCR